MNKAAQVDQSARRGKKYLGEAKFKCNEFGLLQISYRALRDAR